MRHHRSLHCLPGSFVDAKLRERESDLLYSVQLEDWDALLYVLFEHQSTADARMPLRLLGYMLRIWEQYAERNPGLPGKLPPIVPVVLHHDRSAWSFPRRFNDLIAMDDSVAAALRPNLPDFTFVLDDLAKVSTPELRSRETLTAMAMLVLFLLQRARHSPDLVAEFRAFGDVITELSQEPHGVGDLGALLRYTYYVADATLERTRDVLCGHVSPELEEALMTTTAQRLLAEGEARGRAASLTMLLTLKFGSLPSELETRIRNAGVAELDLWTGRVLSATSLERVFEA